MSRFTVAVAVAAVLSVACRDQQPLQTRSIASPSFLISDGAHSGNPFFFFLPPLVPNPSSFFHAGTFDAGLTPVVEVCVLSEDPRLHLPPDPNAAHCVGNPVFGPVAMAVDLANEQYTRNWDTKSPAPLDPSRFYRIQVRGILGGTVFGFVDVDPVDQGVKNIRTGEVVQFQDGRTLPIKVRIEKKAYCNDPNTDCVAKVVGTAGGDVLAENAGVRFFPGNLPGDRVVIVEEVPLKSGERCIPRTPDGEAPRTDLLEYPPCYQFRTDPGPTAFSRSTEGLLPTVAICPDLSAQPSPLQGHRQLFHEEDALGLPDANADFLPCTLTGTIGARTGWRGLLARIFALVTPRPAFAVDEGAGGSAGFFSRFVNAVQPRIEITDGDGQQGVSGARLPLDVSVCVTATHPLHAIPCATPLSGIPVTFTPSGNGAATPGSANSNADGTTTTSWVLATADGENSLVASTPGPGSSRRVIFTATGVTITAQSADATGDAVLDNRVPISPDLVSTTAAAGAGALTVHVRFAPGTFSSQTTLVDVLLDTDQNPATGHPGSNAGGVDDAGIIGVDYIIDMGSAFNGTQAGVFRYAGTLNTFTLIGSVNVAFVSDGMDVSIPLSLLGNDDGQVNFKVTAASQISQSGFSGVLDYMPDLGQPATVLVIPPPLR